MSYCFYEILDNVLTHSGKELGTVITHYDPANHILSFLVALRMCIQDAVTDGKGMGFGLYSTSLLARDAGLHFEVRSGNHTLQVKNGVETTTKSNFWQGTIVYLQLCTNKEINPAEVVANRTNVATQYNETFLNDNELEELW